MRGHDSLKKEEKKSCHCPLGMKRRLEDDRDNKREGEKNGGERPNLPAGKTLNRYISVLIKLQKLISQWLISIKRGFAKTSG